MMGNNVIRAVGKPKNAMYAMLLPSISNLLMDYLFIYLLDLGMYGAALATSLSYLVCAVYIFSFFRSKHSELQTNWDDLKLDLSITKEIGALGFVTLARQSVVSLSVLLVNNILFNLGGESVIAVYAIISRLLCSRFSQFWELPKDLFPMQGIIMELTTKKEWRKLLEQH